MSVKLVKSTGTEYVFPETFRVEGWPGDSAIPSLAVEGRPGAIVDDNDIVEQERSITVSGVMYADTAADLQMAYDALASFVNSSPRLMKLYADEAETRYFLVRKQSMQYRFVKKSGRTLAEVSLTFKASEPFLCGPLWRVLHAHPIQFTRASAAYGSDGTQVAANVPRYEVGQFGQGVMVEEGTTNRLVNALLIDSNADGLADSWMAGNASMLSCANGIQTFTATAQFGAIYQSYDLGVGVISGPWAFSAEIKGLNGRITAYLYDANLTFLGNVSSSLATDDQNFKKFTCISTRTDVRKATFRIEDNRASGWTPISFRKPQLEKGKSYVTSFTDGTRAAESLTIPNNGLITVDGEYTIEGWIQPSRNQADYKNYERLIVFHGPSGFTGLWMGNNLGNGIEFVKNNTYRCQANTLNYSAGDWIHFAAAQYKTAHGAYGPGMHLWVGKNGQPLLHFSNTDVTAIMAPVTELSILQDSGQYVANAIIDDLRISSIGRSETEILADYQSSQPLPVDEYTTLKLAFDGTLNPQMYQPGNVEKQQPVIYIKARSGNLVNPSLTLGGKTLTYTGTIQQGQALLLDAEKVTALLTDASLDYYLNLWGLSSTSAAAPTSETSVIGSMNQGWMLDGFPLPLGTNEVAYSDDATSSHNADVTIAWVPKYY